MRRKPLRTSLSKTARASTPVVPNLADQPRVILLLEDNQDDERLALRALNTCGLPVTVRVARDGQSGLRALGLDGPREEPLPDLVISDLKMPMLNGDEVLAKVRATDRLKDLPFVIFSSSEEPSDLKRCTDLGVDAYYVKPVKFNEFLDCTRAIVHQWLSPGGEEVEPACEIKLSAGKS